MRGFSLVELSIVLVILGLLTGGILAGQALIHAAELRAIHRDYARYASAAYAFRDKYMALPGDMANASSFWGLLGTGATCNTTAATGTATCNGNGNGQVGTSGGTGNETFRFWHHLVNAGLIEGFYTGAGTIDSITGVNVPDGRLNGAGWCARWDNAGFASVFFDMPAGHAFLLGAPNSSDPCQDGFVNPPDMWNIDKKADDGVPGTGKIIAGIRTTCTNASSTSDFAATYQMNRTDNPCIALFKDPF